MLKSQKIVKPNNVKGCDEQENQRTLKTG